MNMPDAQLTFLDDMLSQPAATFGDKPAFIFKDDQLSFAELDAQSTGLAAALQREGIAREDRIGLFLHRGLEAPVALFGCLKAGAAFVPLDPHAPKARLRQIVEATGMRAIVTTDALNTKARDLIAGLDPDVMLIGPGDSALPWTTACACSNDVSRSGRTREDLAYVIFTSGSTGVPKGIMHTHRSGVGFLQNLTGAIDIGPEDVMCAMSPLIFDMALNEYFGGPLRGATVVIATDGDVKLPASLGPLLAKHKVTIYCSVPSLLIRFLGIPQSASLSSVRWVLTGGEPIAPKHVSAAFDLMPHAVYANLFGPTETNTCCIHVLDRDQVNTLESIPIGRPGASNKIQIMDDQGQPVTPVTPGELWVSGGSVMVGYWQNETQTKDRLVAMTGDNGRQDIYLKTGDQVQRDPDGVLHYLGRLDRQVKVRGYRVELDEIEVALASDPDVAEAAAVSFRMEDGATRIGAAVSMRDADSTTPARLSSLLKDKLPVYARPDHIRIIDQMPRTASDKIARRALIPLFEETKDQSDAT